MAVEKINVGTVLPQTTKLKVIMGHEYDYDWSFLPNCPVMGTVFETTNSYLKVESGWTGMVFEGDPFVYREVVGVRFDMISWANNSTCGIDNNLNCNTSNIFTVDTSTWTLEQRTVTQVYQDLSMFGIEMQYEDIGETVTPPPSIADKLLQLNQIKTNIKVAIEDKGSDLTDVEFIGYAGKIHDLPAVVELTQAQYDALSSYHYNTYYLIVEEE